jgi:error-prone DNA polymerase
MTAALTATIIHYRPRSAIRETAKVFGLTEDITADLASGGRLGPQPSENRCGRASSIPSTG